MCEQSPLKVSDLVPLFGQRLFRIFGEKYHGLGVTSHETINVKSWRGWQQHRCLIYEGIIFEDSVSL